MPVDILSLLMSADTVTPHDTIDTIIPHVSWYRPPLMSVTTLTPFSLISYFRGPIVLMDNNSFVAILTATFFLLVALFTPIIYTCIFCGHFFKVSTTNGTIQIHLMCSDNFSPSLMISIIKCSVISFLVNGKMDINTVYGHSVHLWSWAEIISFTVRYITVQIFE